MAPAKRILVVDDDPTIRELVISILRRRDLIVDEARDGREALDLLQQNSYSVVLLDLVMPDIDGFRVLDKIGSPVATPVVLVVTGADRSVTQQLDPDRIHGIVRKPFDPDELANLVMACAEIRSRTAFDAMAISAMIAGGHLLAWLGRFGG